MVSEVELGCQRSPSGKAAAEYGATRLSADRVRRSPTSVDLVVKALMWPPLGLATLAVALVLCWWEHCYPEGQVASNPVRDLGGAPAELRHEHRLCLVEWLRQVEWVSTLPPPSVHADRPSSSVSWELTYHYSPTSAGRLSTWLRRAEAGKSG